MAATNVETTQTATATLQHGGPVITRQLAAEGAPVVFGLPGAGQYEATDAIWPFGAVWQLLRPLLPLGLWAAFLRTPRFSDLPQWPGTLPLLGVCVLANSWTAEGATPAEDLSMLRPLCKWAGRADATEQVPSILHEAFTQMRSGRPGAAVVELSRAALQDGRIDDPGMVFPDPAPDRIFLGNPESLT